MPRKGELQTHCKNGHPRVAESVDKQGHCIPCAVVYHKQWKKKNLVSVRTANRRSHLKNTYSIDQDKFSLLLQKQDNACAICKQPFTDDLKRGPHIDHDHVCCPGARSCGRCVRGLLCHYCNIVIAYAKDNPTILTNAIQYLKETQCQTQQKRTTSALKASLATMV